MLTSNFMLVDLSTFPVLLMTSIPCCLRRVQSLHCSHAENIPNTLHIEIKLSDRTILVPYSIRSKTFSPSQLGGT